MLELTSLLNSICRPRLRDIAAGGTVFEQGDPADAILQVKEGLVRLVRYTDSGDSLTLFCATPGQTFAEAALFSDVYHCTAVADMQSCVALFSKNELLAGLKEQPALMLNLISLLSRQVRELRTLLEIRTIKAAPDRIIQYLRVQANPISGIFTVGTTLKDIAQELGLAHETLYRVLSDLEKEGKIKRDGRTIHLILNTDKGPL